MKIPTETEIKAMNNTDSRTMYHSLEKEYKIKFEKEYIPEPGGEQVTLEDELISLARLRPCLKNKTCTKNRKMIK